MTSVLTDQTKSQVFNPPPPVLNNYNEGKSFLLAQLMSRCVQHTPQWAAREKKA